MAERTAPGSGWMDVPLSTTGLPGADKASSLAAASQEKQVSVQDRALQKMALLGSAEEQHVIATAEMQGNVPGQAPEIQDIRRLRPAEFALKYGHEAERMRAEYARTYLGLQDFKGRERSTGEMLKDAAIDATKMATNTVAGVGILGLNAQDLIFGTTASPIASEALGELNQAMEGQQSQLMQDRRAQHQLEAALDAQDREARHAARMETAAGAGNLWDRAVAPRLQNWTEEAGETITNYADDPIMAGSLVPEAVGSLIPSTVGIKIAGRAGALRELARRGLTRDAAEMALLSPGGQAVLEAQTLRMAPLVMGLTETGGAIHQSQLDILSQDEAALSESPQYQQLRAGGASHEEAQMQLARQAGTVAGTMAAPGALAAGRIASGVAAYPMRAGGVGRVAGHVAQEGAEEFLQEANAQLSTNIGARSIGLERELDEGVMAAGAEGLLGGVASIGALQGSAAAADAAARLASRAAIAGKQTAAEWAAGRHQRQAEARDANNPVGTQARAAASSGLTEAAERIIAQLSNTTPNQVEAETAVGTTSEIMQQPDMAARREVAARIREGLYAEDRDALGISGVHAGAAEALQANGRLTRSQALEFTADLMDATEDVGGKTQMAIGVLEQMDAMRRLDASDVSNLMDTLSEDDPLRENFGQVRTTLATLEASPRVQAAIELVEAMTPEMFQEMVPLDVLDDPEADPGLRNDVSKVLKTVLAVNPSVYGSQDYDRILSQLENIPAADRAALTGARNAMSIFEAHATTREALEAEIPGVTQDIVSEEIHVRGNSKNGMPSLKQHRANVENAMASGRQEEAYDALLDLRDFAASLANKVGALNRSATPGAEFGKRVGYAASGPYGIFFRNDGAFVNQGSPKSLALAKAVHADATAAARLVDVLADQHNLAHEQVEVPTLHGNITAPSPNQPSRGTGAEPRPAQAKTKKSKPAKKAASESRLSSEERARLETQLESQRVERRLAGLASQHRRARTARIKALRAMAKAAGDTAAYEEARKTSAARVAEIAEIETLIRELGGEVPKMQPEPVPEETPEPELNPILETPVEEPVVDVLPVPEVASEEAPAEEPAESSGTEEAEADQGASWFEQLTERLPANWEGKQRFVEAFRPVGNGSRLLEAEAPIAWLQESVEVAGYSPEQTEALIELLDSGYLDFAGDIQAALEAFLEKKKLTTPEALTRALAFPEGLPLNLTVTSADGTRYIEPKVMTALFVSTFEWLGQNARKPRSMDAEDVAKMFGLSRGGAVSDELMGATQFGTLQMAAQESIARTMMELLDVAPRTDGDIRTTQGMFRALAANALEVLMDVRDKDGNVTEARTLEWRSVSYQVDGASREAIFVQPRKEIAEADSSRALTDLRTPFSGLLTDGRTKDRHIGNAPKAVARTRLHNRLSELSAPEMQAIERLQNIPSRVNQPMVALVRAIGVDAYRRLLGHVELNELTRQDYSPGHLRSLEGVNQTIEHDLAETLGYVVEAEAAAGEDGVPAPIFHSWEISSVGRLQQQGPVTPQGSKIAREMIAATNSVLELTGENAERHEWALWAAVAQALDVKIEKLGRDEIPQAAKQRIAKDFRQALTLLEDMAAGHSLDAAALLEALPKGISAKGLHALLTAARFNVAKASLDDGGAETFETALALEADGKTDGPVNAMIHMGIGPFRAEELQLFAKGGLFFTPHETSLADFIAQEGTGGEDIYNMASARLRQNLGATLQGTTAPPVLEMLHAFLPGFELRSLDRDTGAVVEELSVSRNVIKNPLTVFLYGSGDDGIAGKIAGQVADKLNEFLSELIQNGKKGLRVRDHKLIQENPDLLEIMSIVLFEGDGVRLRSWLRKPQEAQITEEMRAFLQAHVLMSFVEPMVAAIDDTTGGLQGRMKFLQAVAEMQTLIFQDVFRKAMDKAQAAKDAALEPQREAAKAEGRQIAKALLTEQEVRDVFAETMKIAPIYGNGVQEFQISTPERAPLENVTVAESFSGRLKSRATYVAPSDASVKVSPFLTIGNGDGRMILNIYTNGDGSFDVSLPVFDGVEMALDTIEGASRQINEQTLQAWQQANPYRDVAQGFSQLLAHLSPEMVAGLPPAVQARITKLGKQLGMPGSPQQVLAEVDTALTVAAQEREARVAAMARAAISADHMASAQQPAVQAGLAAASGLATDYDATAAVLNGTYQAELSRIRDEASTSEDRPTVAGYAQAPTKELAASIQQIGEEVPGHPNLRRMSGAAALRLLAGRQDKTGATADQRGLAQEMANVGGLEQVSVFLGSPEDLATFRTQLNQDPDRTGPQLPEVPIELGQSYSQSGVVMVANASPETLLHELIHQLTDTVLVRHYADLASSPAYVRHAVGQLEKLMGDVRELSVYGLEPADARALHTLKEVLSRAADPAAQLGEFVSYVLTNPGLIEKAKSTPNYRGLTSIVTNALKWIRNLLGVKVSPGKTLYSNVRFNARLLLAQEPARDGAQTETDRVLSQVYGDDARLDRVEALFLNRLGAVLEGALAQIPAGVNQATRDAIQRKTELEISKKVAAGRNAATRANGARFELNDREVTAFETVHAVAASGLVTGQPVQRHLDEALNHVLTNLTAADILRAMGAETPTQDQKARAEEMVAYLTEARRSNPADLLPSFLALSQTSPLFREALAGMAPPKVAALRWDSVDAWMQSLGRTMVNLLTRLSLQPRLRTSADMRQELDALAGTLAEIQKDRAGIAQLRQAGELFGRGVDAANAYASRKLADGSEAAAEFMQDTAARFDSPYAQASFRVLGGLASLGSSQAATATGDALSRMLNESAGWHAARSALTDIRGMTADNAPLWRLINPAKAKIDSVRQDSREGVPRHLAAAFSRQLAPEEWSRMHKGLAQIDLMALGHAEVLALLRDPSTTDAEVARLEEQVSQLGGALAPRFKAKAKALAIFLARGQSTSQNLLTNAYAIAHLLGEKAPKDHAPSDELIQAIDQLTSLYAWQLLDAPVRDGLASLAQEQPAGMQAVTGFLRVSRQAEIERRDRHGGINRVALHNGWKGYVPATVQEGHAVIVRPASEHDELLRRGYVRIGAYHGDPNDIKTLGLSYYQSSVAGKGAFRQGVAQTVNDTWQGVDARTGLSIDQRAAGTLLGARVTRIAQKLRGSRPGSLDGLRPGEYLRPIFDEQGEVAAYERMADPTMAARVPVDDHLGRMLGVWVGRILEEKLSDEVNQDLVGVLKGIYDAGRTKGELEGFVNIANPNNPDPVIRDAWNTLGWRIKREIEDAFGEGEFWVRRDMVDDAIGFRAATVTDAWTGVSRWSPETQARMREVAEFIHPDAFKYLRKADKVLREGVSWAKETIIIRSVIVSVGNVLSNVGHLLMLGIQIQDVVKGSRDKLAEITEYVKNREEIQKLQVSMASVIHDPKAMARYETRIGALEEVNRKLSIAPLLEAGEFNTVAEGLDEADVAFRNGKMGEFFDRAVSRLPGWGKTAAKNIAITKDTALYQGLTRSVQYGDFIAKAVLYDHLTKQEGMEQRDALDRVLEEFIPYNRLAGRDRDVLEAMGLAWFLNYKLRSLPVLARVMRERPLSALVMFSGGGPVSGVQTLWDGSLPGSTLDGRIGFSFGPEMGLNSPALHPIGALVL